MEAEKQLREETITEHKAYIKPQIILELELETYAGSPLGIPFPEDLEE